MHKPIHYKANRGGHAPGYLREAFLDWLSNWSDEIADLADTCEYDGEEDVPVKDVFGLLWNCTDIMPSFACDVLDLPKGSTYAQGVRKAKELRTVEIKAG